MRKDSNNKEIQINHLMDFKATTHFITIVSLCFTLIGCDNQSKKSEALQGSWFYFYDDFYFELHITSEHFIYQSDIMGTEIKQYELLSDGKIRLYNGENDTNPTLIKLVDLNTEAPYLEQEQNQFFLNRINTETIDIQKLLKVNSLYYQSFIESFNKRRLKNTTEHNKLSLHSAYN